MLAQAGGSAVATKMENKVAPILKKMGVNGIVYTFDGEGNYTSKIKKHETKGTYTFDKKNQHHIHSHLWQGVHRLRVYTRLDNDAYIKF